MIQRETLCLNRLLRIGGYGSAATGSQESRASIDWDTKFEALRPENRSRQSSLALQMFVLLRQRSTASILGAIRCLL